MKTTCNIIIVGSSCVGKSVVANYFADSHALTVCHELEQLKHYDVREGIVVTILPSEIAAAQELLPNATIIEILRPTERQPDTVSGGYMLLLNDGTEAQLFERATQLFNDITGCPVA